MGSGVSLLPDLQIPLSHYVPHGFYSIYAHGKGDEDVEEEGKEKSGGRRKNRKEERRGGEREKEKGEERERGLALLIRH